MIDWRTILKTQPPSHNPQNTQNGELAGNFEHIEDYASRPVVERAASKARPVYWQTNDGRILGPALPEFLAQIGTGETARFLVLVQHEGQFRFIESDRLRSSQAHAIQHDLYAAERGEIF